MRRNSLWLAGVLVFLPASVGLADGPASPAIPVIKLKVQPARAPVPALKYRLLPELRDLKPGNAVISYYRAFSPEWQTFQREKNFWKWVEKWDDDKSKPPPAELDFVKHFNALKEFDIGARRAYCDWEMTDRLRKEGLVMLLPDVQSFRTYSVLLAARSRFEMLDKKYDQALYTLETGFTLGRHVGDGPTLIQALVGIAMTQQMVMEVEQLIQQPGAPNLYWALTDLPAPFIDLRHPLQGEKIVIDSMFPGWREMLADPKARPLPPGDFTDSLARNVGSLQDMSSGVSTGWEIKPVLAVLAAKSYPEARKFLLEQGRAEKIVDEMPVAQVALLYEIHNMDRFYDDMIKWYGQSYPVMRKGMQQADNQIREAKASGAAGTFLATLLVPAAQKVFNTSYRLDRKLAALRCVEAIRLYAASHEGKVPASLKDIEEVPVPNDPYTGQPFEYTASGGGAVLTAPLPPRTALSSNAWRIEITMEPAPKRSTP